LNVTFPEDMQQHLQISMDSVGIIPQDSEGYKRNKELQGKSTVSYSQLKRIKNYFDNYKGDVNSPEFVLNGGLKMKAWVDLQLNQMRANIKMTKMNRTNAGETNQFIDNHEKEGIIRPSQTHRKTVERHATSIPKFPKITEEINKIKKLIKY
jgi:hypothetical protein